MTETDYASAVALIGMSGRFPGADSVADLWRNVLSGIKGLREITDAELRETGVEPGRSPTRATCGSAARWPTWSTSTRGSSGSTRARPR